jgi:hypothetical protein
MARWYLALDGDSVLTEGAKAKLFKPYVLEEDGGDSSYGYGWVVVPAERIAWHNGGNCCSYGEKTIWRDEGVMVFWVSNHGIWMGDGTFTSWQEG